MSITVVAVPISIQLLATIAPIVIEVSSLAINYDDITASFDEKYGIKNLSNNLPNIYDKECEVKYITEANLLEKSFETPFTSKEILLKTLEEHGVKNLKEEYTGKITGEVASFKFVFTRTNETESYKVIISYLENDNVDEKIQDINNEYTLNVQEESYLNIIEKLKENKLELESEEVLEDNTIVLTINLE